MTRYFESHSVFETELLGASLASDLHHGQVIGMRGELGSGKTAFVRGLARGLGCTDRVHSPTFALLNQYGGGRLALFHIDLYRLNSVEQIRAAGLEEYLVAPAGVCVVEWIERWTEDRAGEAASAGLARVNFQIVDEQTRAITYELVGA